MRNFSVQTQSSAHVNKCAYVKCSMYAVCICVGIKWKRSKTFLENRVHCNENRMQLVAQFNNYLAIEAYKIYSGFYVICLLVVTHHHHQRRCRCRRCRYVVVVIFIISIDFMPSIQQAPVYIGFVGCSNIYKRIRSLTVYAESFWVCKLHSDHLSITQFSLKQRNVRRQ